MVKPANHRPLTSAAHLVLGRQGEAVAERYLLGLGYAIRARNIRLRRCEIDLIAFDPREQMLVFVEVKTRAADSLSYPIHSAITGRKRRALRLAVSRWVIREAYDGPGRIDVVCVCGERVVEHLKAIGSDFFVE